MTITNVAPQSKITCETCQHCYSTELNTDLTRQYFCRRYPPTPLAVQRGAQVQVVNVYPVIAADNVCGEHLPVASP